VKLNAQKELKLAGCYVRKKRLSLRSRRLKRGNSSVEVAEEGAGWCGRNINAAEADAEMRALWSELLKRRHVVRSDKAAEARSG
jgi:hypothetical protein